MNAVSETSVLQDKNVHEREAEIQQQAVISPLPCGFSGHPRVSAPGSLSREVFDLFFSVGHGRSTITIICLFKEIPGKEAFFEYFCFPLR